MAYLASLVQKDVRRGIPCRLENSIYEASQQMPNLKVAKAASLKWQEEEQLFFRQVVDKWNDHSGVNPVGCALTDKVLEEGDQYIGESCDIWYHDNYGQYLSSDNFYSYSEDRYKDVMEYNYWTYRQDPVWLRLLECRGKPFEIGIHGATSVVWNPSYELQRFEPNFTAWFKKTFSADQMLTEAMEHHKKKVNLCRSKPLECQKRHNALFNTWYEHKYPNDLHNRLLKNKVREAVRFDKCILKEMVDLSSGIRK